MARTIYVPPFSNQLKSGDPLGAYDCTAFGCQFAISRATLGGVFVSGADIRRLSDEPVLNRKDPGLNLDQVIAVAARFHVVLDRVNAPWPVIASRIKAGAGAIVTVSYDLMGSSSCQPSFRGGHAIFINHYSTPPQSIMTLDPLCNSAKWVPEATIRAAGEKWGMIMGLPKKQVAVAFTRTTPMIWK